MPTDPNDPRRDDPPPRRRPLEETKPPREWQSAPPSWNSPRMAPLPQGRPSPGLATPEPPPDKPAPQTLAGREMAAMSAGRETPDRSVATAAGPETSAGLPSCYGIDQLVLLVRDPHWTYAWWELTEGNLAAGRREVGTACRLVLRFYDVSWIEWDGANHHTSFDIEIRDPAGNWYVELGKPGATFVAEIGWCDDSGRFRPLVRSNFAALPRDAMSPIVDERWRIREEEYRRMFELSGGDAIGLGSGEIVRALEERLHRELLEGGVSSFGVSSLASRRQT